MKESNTMSRFLSVVDKHVKQIGYINTILTYPLDKPQRKQYTFDKIV
jgi:xylose isomerase